MSYDDTASEAYRVRENSLAESPCNIARADARAQDVIARWYPTEAARMPLAGVLGLLERDRGVVGHEPAEAFLGARFVSRRSGSDRFARG